MTDLALVNANVLTIATIVDDECRYDADALDGLS